MTVTIDKIRLEPPTRKDHLLKVPRQALFISQLDEWRQAKDDEELIEYHLHRTANLDTRKILTYSAIVCDSCNDPIPYPYIWCLIIGGSYSWGTLCEECKNKYHSKLPQYVLAPKGV